MKLIITPTYTDIFDEPIPDFNDLIKDIPTDLLLKVVSVVNAQLYLNLTKELSQKNILNLLLKRNQITLKKVQKAIFQMIQEESWEHVQLFTTHISLEFLHNAIINYTENNNFVDTTPEQELAVFKAFLIVSESVSAKSNIEPQENIDDTFQSIIWPILLAQYQINEPHNYFTSLVKAKCLFDALESNDTYRPFVNKFIQKYNCANTLTYSMNIVKMIQSSHIKDSDEITRYRIIASDESINSILQDFSIDLIDYSKRFQEAKLNFNGFKDKPLFNDKDGVYYVIDWNFLAGKIYHGLPFDFYSKSGINNLVTDKVFFAEIGNFFIEKYLFKKLIESAHRDFHCTKIFDEDPSIGLPDAYIRIGKRIFIFEVKDAFFGSKAIDKYDYQEIKSTIDLKFNSKKKGTSQLVKQIELLTKKLPEQLEYKQLHLKQQNLQIYPIMIYTDNSFQAPGIMQYLRREFEQKLQQQYLNTFGKINPLSFISLDFFIENIDLLKKKENRLDLIIDKVNKELLKREKDFIKHNTRDKHFLKNQSFEQLCSKHNHLNKTKKDSSIYLKTLFTELELNKGL